MKTLKLFDFLDLSKILSKLPLCFPIMLGSRFKLNSLGKDRVSLDSLYSDSKLLLEDHTRIILENALNQNIHSSNTEIAELENKIKILQTKLLQSANQLEELKSNKSLEDFYNSLLE